MTTPNPTYLITARAELLAAEQALAEARKDHAADLSGVTERFYVALERTYAAQLMAHGVFGT